SDLPVVLVFWWLRERKLRWEWLLPPCLYYLVFSLLARDLRTFFRIAHIIGSVMNAPYAAQYQSGPPQRLLIDFMAVAPLVTIAFLAIAVRPHPALRATLSRNAGEGRGEGVLVLALGILIVHSLISSK